MLSETEEDYLDRAVDLAITAEQKGNLPIGAVVILDDKIIAEGSNAIWFPEYGQNRHAEIEALRSVPKQLWPRSRAMTLFTTLEPCLMCTGAILLHHLGKVVCGAADPTGGGGCVFGHMPPFLEEELKQTEWIGPVLHGPCDELASRAIRLVRARQEAGLIV
jgi:tRNA(adenine34) deaminase